MRLVPRRRSPRHLTCAEREEICRGTAAGETARQVARRLGRSPSTVSRKIPERRPRPIPRSTSRYRGLERSRRP
ncbi:helix-turn-helix domain-containing protein [Streptomyces tendae]|uniref:helix-turn-helix domain-containing protein n=1 Tax=Streptomyces tendae TaxID=1932 RepID=UPI0036B89AD3